MDAHPVPAGRGIPCRPRYAGRNTVQIFDVLADPEYQFRGQNLVAREPCLASRCCGKDCRSESSICSARRCGRLPSVKSSFYDLRRPGGDRDRERAAVRRGAGAHARIVRGAGAANRDLRGAPGHHQLARRTCRRIRWRCWRTAARICDANDATDAPVRRRFS